MELIPFWSDPVGWSRNITGKGYNYHFCQLIHIGMGFLSFIFFEDVFGRMFGTVLGLLVALPPLMYLYVIKGLLEELKKHQNNPVG